MYLLQERKPSRELLLKKTIDKMARLLKLNHIALPKGARKTDCGSKIDDHERFHALKAVFLQSQAFVIDFGASNHMVTSK